jgi:signal transduction histidine kinase
MTSDKAVAAAEIAHDLRNLLQVAASALIQIDRNLDCATRERVRVFEFAASESLARAGALSRALIGGGTGGSAGWLRDVVEAVSLAQAVVTIAPMIELAAGPAVCVAYEISNDAPSVACRLADLENAILNLVANARDAMPGGGHLTVSLVRDRNAALLQVRDTGAGMDAETARRVFTRYFTTKSTSGGSGLGLSIVRDFAERAGGSALIDSCIGVGTAVTLRLPGMSCATAFPRPRMEVDHEQ